MLQLINIHKSFASTPALRGVSFAVQRGEILALLGPSGCGKSTLLGIIAGLFPPDQGEVLWGGNSLAGIPIHQRGFGLMFQDFALFPHLNVGKNIAFGLSMQDLTLAESEQRVSEILTLVGLPGFEKRDVNTLSGGEQQRIALARSLAPHPHLLMLDEPLGALDRTLRERLVVELKHILKGTQQTAIYVTHDQEEAFVVADRVVVMNAGQVEQTGTPQEIYCSPRSPFVARFLDMGNLLPGEVKLVGDQPILSSAVGDFPIFHPIRGPVTVLFRPDAAQLDGLGTIHLAGRILELSFRGSSQRMRIMVGKTALSFIFPSSVLLPPAGSNLTIHLDADRGILIFPPEEPS